MNCASKTVPKLLPFMHFAIEFSYLELGSLALTCVGCGVDVLLSKILALLVLGASDVSAPLARVSSINITHSCNSARIFPDASISSCKASCVEFSSSHIILCISSSNVFNCPNFSSRASFACFIALFRSPSYPSTNSWAFATNFLTRPRCPPLDFFFVVKSAIVHSLGFSISIRLEGPVVANPSH